MKGIKLTLTLAGAILLGGCASNCVTISSNSNKSVDVGSGFFGDFGVTPSASKLAGDLMYAKVAVYNKTDKNQSLKYQFEWLGTDGFAQGQPTPWQPLQLLPNMSRVVSAVAPTSEATNFNVNVCQ